MGWDGKEDKSIILARGTTCSFGDGAKSRRRMSVKQLAASWVLWLERQGTKRSSESARLIENTRDTLDRDFIRFC